MADIKITGVMRASAYSPNNIDNDAAIFNAVAEQLRKRDCEVSVCTEDQFMNLASPAGVILNMCRKPESIERLIDLEERGRLAINSGKGIANCSRERMTHLFMKNNIPMPESLIVSTSKDVRPLLEEKEFGACWVKRGDEHAVQKDDVVYCISADAAQSALDGFHSRGIEKAVICRHLDGDLVKFYGVRGEKFFYWFYPGDEGHSKYGHEEINGRSRGYEFDADSLHAISQQASEALGVLIYGGDCIIDSEGNPRIIDFNDWPSFSPCRAQAAPAIARAVIKTIQEES